MHDEKCYGGHCVTFSPDASCDDVNWISFWDDLRDTLRSFAPSFPKQWRLSRVKKEHTWVGDPVRMRLRKFAAWAVFCIQPEAPCCQRCPYEHRLGGISCVKALISLRLFSISYYAKWDYTPLSSFGSTLQESMEVIEQEIGQTWLVLSSNSLAELLQDPLQWPIAPFLEYGSLSTPLSTWASVYSQPEVLSDFGTCAEREVVRNLLSPAIARLEQVRELRMEFSHTWTGAASHPDIQDAFDVALLSAQAAAIAAFKRDRASTMHCIADLWRALSETVLDPIVTLVRPQLGFKMWIPPRSDVLADIVRGSREPHCAQVFMDEVKAHLNDESELLLVDVGAAFGDCAVWACATYGAKAKVFSYEPVAEAADALRRSLDLNQHVECNTVVREVALGDRSQKDTQLLVPVSWGTAAFVDTDIDIVSNLSDVKNPKLDSVLHKQFMNGDDLKKQSVDMETLDAEAERFGWGWIDVLKVHVQGLEQFVLSGGHTVLKRAKSVIVRGGTEDIQTQSTVALLEASGLDVVDIGYHVVARRPGIPA